MKPKRPTISEIKKNEKFSKLYKTFGDAIRYGYDNNSGEIDIDEAFIQFLVDSGMVTQDQKKPPKGYYTSGMSIVPFRSIIKLENNSTPINQGRDFDIEYLAHYPNGTIRLHGKDAENFRNQYIAWLDYQDEISQPGVLAESRQASIRVLPEYFCEICSRKNEHVLHEYLLKLPNGHEPNKCLICSNTVFEPHEIRPYEESILPEKERI